MNFGLTRVVKFKGIVINSTANCAIFCMAMMAAKAVVGSTKEAYISALTGFISHLYTRHRTWITEEFLAKIEKTLPGSPDKKKVRAVLIECFVQNQATRLLREEAGTVDQAIQDYKKRRGELVASSHKKLGSAVAAFLGLGDANAATAMGAVTHTHAQHGMPPITPGIHGADSIMCGVSMS